MNHCRMSSTSLGNCRPGRATTVPKCVSQMLSERRGEGRTNGSVTGGKQDDESRHNDENDITNLKTAAWSTMRKRPGPINQEWNVEQGVLVQLQNLVTSCDGREVFH